MPAPLPPPMPLRVTRDGVTWEAHAPGLACACLPLLEPVYGDGELGRRLLGTSLYHRTRRPAVRTERVTHA